jgi:hypothetical protein
LPVVEVVDDGAEVVVVARPGRVVVVMPEVVVVATVVVVGAVVDDAAGAIVDEARGAAVVVVEPAAGAVVVVGSGDSAGSTVGIGVSTAEGGRRSPAPPGLVVGRERRPTPGTASAENPGIPTKVRPRVAMYPRITTANVPLTMATARPRRPESSTKTGLRAGGEGAGAGSGIGRWPSLTRAGDAAAAPVSSRRLARGG